MPGSYIYGMLNTYFSYIFTRDLECHILSLYIFDIFMFIN